MTQEPRVERRRPEERFAGPEHRFDLGEVASRLRREDTPIRNGHRQIALFSEGALTLILFDFEAGGRLADHSAAGFVVIQAVTGRLTVSTPDGTHDLDAGSLVLLRPGVRHDVTAHEASQMLLTVYDLESEH